MKTIYEYPKYTEKLKNKVCQECGAEKGIRVYHKHYIKNKKIFYYKYHSYKFICNKCIKYNKYHHPKKFNNEDWFLMKIEDHGDKHVNCEKPGCGASIRFSALLYHPLIGYKNISENCIHVDWIKDLVKKIISYYKHSIEFKEHNLKNGTTKKGYKFNYFVYKGEKIKLFYHKDKNYSYQITSKDSNSKFYDSGKKKRKEAIQIAFLGALYRIEKDPIILLIINNLKKQ